MPKFYIKLLYSKEIRILNIILRTSKEDPIFLGAFPSVMSTVHIFKGTDNSLLLLTAYSEVLMSLWLFAPLPSEKADPILRCRRCT